MMQMLLNMGASPHLQYSGGYTALGVAIKYDKPDSIEFLLEKGSRPTNDDMFALITHLDPCQNKIELEEKGLSPLTKAAAEGNVDQVQEQITKNPDLLNKPDKQGLSPLMQAAKYGQAETATLLLNCGALVSLRDTKNETALSKACQYGQFPLISILMTRGDKITADDMKAAVKHFRNLPRYQGYSYDGNVVFHNMVFLLGGLSALAWSLGRKALAVPVLGLIGYKLYNRKPQELAQQSEGMQNEPDTNKVGAELTQASSSSRPESALSMGNDWDSIRPASSASQRFFTKASLPSRINKSFHSSINADDLTQVSQANSFTPESLISFTHETLKSGKSSENSSVLGTDIFPSLSGLQSLGSSIHPLEPDINTANVSSLALDRAHQIVRLIEKKTFLTEPITHELRTQLNFETAVSLSQLLKQKIEQHQLSEDEVEALILDHRRQSLQSNADPQKTVLKFWKTVDKVFSMDAE